MQALIFDLDGTLLDTVYAHVFAWQRAFAEIGLELKQRSPIQPLMNISIANGAHGYLPTPEQHKLGGYETWIGVNKVQLDASVKMVNALVEMLGELNAKKP